MCDKTDEFPPKWGHLVPSYEGDKEFEKFGSEIFMEKLKLESIRIVIENKEKQMAILRQELASLFNEKNKITNNLDEMFDTWKNS